jgi:hypothetical protein
MSTATDIQAHIAYELIEDDKHQVVIIEFLNHDITSPHHAHELGKQLDSLIRREPPQYFIIDCAGVKALGSTASVRLYRSSTRRGRCGCATSTARLGSGLRWSAWTTGPSLPPPGGRQSRKRSGPPAGMKRIPSTTPLGLADGSAVPEPSSFISRWIAAVGVGVFVLALACGKIASV